MDQKTTEELLNIKKLLEAGVLTQQEFEARKQQLMESLGNNRGGGPPEDGAGSDNHDDGLSSPLGGLMSRELMKRISVSLAILMCAALFVVAWTVGAEKKSDGAATKVAKKAPAVTMNVFGMKFVSISPGSFEMGCTPEQSDCQEYEAPAHKVTLTRGFQIQTTEVTQGQYQAVMGTNPSTAWQCGPDCPVERVWHYDAIRFANALSIEEGLRPAYSGPSSNYQWDKFANGYRLPTEAEWEYAARAGQATRYSGSNELDDVAWAKSNNSNKIHKVGTKKANAWGLHDMSGNVREWCWDWHGDSYYRSSPDADPVGVTSGFRRVMRGGGGNDEPDYLTVVARGRIEPDRKASSTGFRVVRTIPACNGHNSDTPLAKQACF